MDRFLEALKSIRAEICEIESGAADKENNVLKHAPHPEYLVVTDEWNNPYGREKAAYPLPWVRENKFWPCVARIDEAFGDRNLMTTCDSLDSLL